MGGGEVIKRGWLIKSPPLEGGGIKAWRKRYFMLRSSKVLEYYKSDDGELLKGVINLEDCRMVHADLSHKKYKYVFDIETRERTYYLVAQTQQEMKGWVDTLCEICGLIVQAVPEFISPVEVTSAPSSSANSGPSITSPIYSTTPATRATSSGGVAFNERFRPSDGAMGESMYSLAQSADAELQRQLSREQEVPAGTPLSEALASKGMSSGTCTSSVSSASAGEANTSSDSPSFLSPRHEPALDIQNLYSPVPKKTSGGVAKPVPKPRAATLNPRGSDPTGLSDFTASLQLSGGGSAAVGGTLPPGGSLTPTPGRAEMRDDGYLRPRPATRNNYDHLPPARPAIQNSPSPKQHRSALLRDRTALQDTPPSTPSSSSVPPAGPTYINVRQNMLDEAPPPIDRRCKPLEPSPPRVDRKLKPKTESESDCESPPVFPTRSSSLANALENHSHSPPPPSASGPDFPTRTTSLGAGQEVATSFSGGDAFSETDLPKPSTRTMQYSQIEFDAETGKPVLSGRANSSQDVRQHPIPTPRRVNYTDIDLTATNALAKNFKTPPKRQVSLRDAERKALADKPYINVNREGDVDEDSDPGYYIHMRNLTYEEAMEYYKDLSMENIDVSSEEEEMR